MKTFFTPVKFLLIILCVLLGHTNFAQPYPYSEIIEGTVRNGEVDTYYPMANFNSSAYEEYSYITRTAPPPGNFTNFNFRLLPPVGYDDAADDGKEYPLIVMLHGVGEAGVNRSQYGGLYSNEDPRKENNDHQMVFGGSNHLNARNRAASGQSGQKFPGFVLFPQAPDGDWTGENSDIMIEIVERLIEEKKIDPLKIYIWGLSNGGVGTWAAVSKRPDLFAAALPMCGVPNTAVNNAFPNWPEELAHMPIWMFAGGKDDNPSLGNVNGQLKKLYDLGGNPILTVYPEREHDVWYQAYEEPDFFSWMLQYSELSIHAFYGKTQICAGQELDIKLGISPGHAEYQWSLNGTQEENIIPGSNHYNFEPSELGEYRVRIIRQGEMEWTQWSDPVDVKISEPYVPELLVSHSTMKPSLDGVDTVTLTYPGDFDQIEWYLNYGKTTDNKRSRTTKSVRTQGMYWQARVLLSNGCWSEMSDTVYMRTGAPTNMLPPDGVTTIPVSYNRINLLWEDNSDNERGFEIYRAKAPDGPYTFVTKTAADEEFYIDKGLEANTTYYYQMRAINWNGISPYTGIIQGTTLEDLEAPSRPGNLTASANLDLESISLKWNAATDNDGVAGYNVYEVQTDNSLTLVEANIAETSFIVGNLTQGEHYTYVVKAVDKSGNLSESSNQASAETEFCGLQYTLYSGGPWDSVFDFEDAQIASTGKVDNFDISVRSGVGNDNFGFEFGGIIKIASEGQYTFYTTSDDGSYLWINDEPVVTTNDGAHGTQERSGSVYLSEGNHTIKVRFFENGGGENLTVAYAGPGISKRTIGANVLCMDGYSEEIPPAAPSNLEATASVSEENTNEISLTWSDNSVDETGFEIYRSKVEVGGFELVHVTDADVTEYVDEQYLESSLTYYYYIRAVGATGGSAYSNTASASTLDDTTPPSPVLNLTVVNNSDHNARLSWTESTDNVGVVGYNIYRHFEGEEVLLAKADVEGDAIAYVPQAEGEMTLLNEAETNPTMYFLLKGLSSGTNYTLEVKAVDAAGNESVGNSTDNFNTGGPTPQPIELKDFSAKVENKTVKLTWKTASETNNNFFTLERADNSKDFYEIGTVDGAGTSIEELSYSFTDYNPVNGKMYYRLKQTDFNGDFKYFDIISVQYAFAGELILYPNPTSSDNINLRLEGNSNFEPGLIKILDVVGNSYLESSFETDDLATGVKVGVKNALTPGLYFVIIEQGDTVSKMKLIIK